MTIEGLGNTPVGLAFADQTWLLHIARYACRRWRELSAGEVLPVKVRENAVFKVINPLGERYALRIHRLGYHTDLSLASEYRWMEALRDWGLLTPKLVRSRQGLAFERVACGGESYQVDAFEWIESTGINFPAGGGGAPLAQIAIQYRMMGEVMRRAHDQADSWSPPPPFARHSWDLEGLIGENPLWGRFWEYGALDPEQRQLMVELRSNLKSRLGQMSTARGRFGLIHADLMPDNVIPTCNGLYVIDFDDAGYGWYLYDVAVTLFSFTQHPQFELIKQAFFDGYRPNAPLDSQETLDLEMFIAARSATLIGWLHSRAQEETRARAPWLIALACRAAHLWLSHMRQ